MARCTPAVLAAAPEAGQQVDNSVFEHLGDGGQDPASGPLIWGNASGDFGSWGADKYASGFSADTYQLLAGADLVAVGAARKGAGYAHTHSDIRANQGTGSVDENAGFIYGQAPLASFVVDAVGSNGVTGSSTNRPDPLSSATLASGANGHDALVSLGLRRPMLRSNLLLAPYVRVVWQQLSQDASSEGSSSLVALDVHGFSGTGVRTIVGLTGGSAATSPLAAPSTYQFDLGVGEDTGRLLSPTLDASYAELGPSLGGTTITSPHVGRAFARLSLSGTLRLGQNAYVYGALSGEARSGATLGTATGGIRWQF
jgi:fibronectin-binding autotransporter adhesin